MQSLPSKQRGLTFISLVFLLGLIAFFTLLVLKIAPIYFDNSKVKNAVAAVGQMVDIANKPRQEILSSLEKRFNLNYVDFISRDEIKIIAQPGYVKLDIEYERIEPILGNLSVLVEFHEGFEVGGK